MRCACTLLRFTTFAATCGITLILTAFALYAVHVYCLDFGCFRTFATVGELSVLHSYTCTLAFLMPVLPSLIHWIENLNGSPLEPGTRTYLQWARLPVLLAGAWAKRLYDAVTSFCIYCCAPPDFLVPAAFAQFNQYLHDFF